MKNDENILSKNNNATTNFPLIRRQKIMDHFDERPLSLYDNLLITPTANSINITATTSITTAATTTTTAATPTATTTTTTTTPATAPSTMNSAAIRTISHHNPNHEQHHHHQQYYHHHHQQPQQINDKQNYHSNNNSNNSNSSLAQLNLSPTSLARQPPAATVPLTKITTPISQNQHSNCENEFPFQDISFKFDDLPQQQRQQQTHNLLNNYDKNNTILNTNISPTNTTTTNNNNNNNNNDINNKNKYNNHENHNNSRGYNNTNDRQLIITGNHIISNYTNNNNNNNSTPVTGTVPTASDVAVAASAATTTATIENYSKNNNVDTNTNIITITTNTKPTTTTTTPPTAMTKLYETTILPPPQPKLVQYENVSETVKLRNSNRHQVLNKPVISDAKSSFFGLVQTSQTPETSQLQLSPPLSPSQSPLQSNQIITSTPKHSTNMILNNNDRSPLINGAANNHHHNRLINSIHNNNNNNNNGDFNGETTTNLNQIKPNIVEYQNIPSNSACYGKYLAGGQSPPQINVIPSSPRRYSHHSEWHPLDSAGDMGSTPSPINSAGASCSKHNYLPSCSTTSADYTDGDPTFDHRPHLNCCDSSGNVGFNGSNNTSRIGNDSSGTTTNSFFMEASRRLNETQPSQAVYLTTTVPQNIKGSNIAGRHTPTRTSLRHSRMIVVNKHLQAHQKPNPLEIKHPTAAKLLLIFQLMVGFCIASLALWILLWAPNTRTRDNPYWSGLSLLLAGILGLILIEFKRIPRQKLREHCFTFMRLNSMTFSVLATVISFMACLFAALHLDNITSSTTTCMSANIFTTNAACICLFGAGNSTDQLEIKTVEEGKITAGGIEFQYRDLSCSEVTGAWKYILIASTALNLLGFAISFVYLLLLCLPAKSKRQRRRKTSYSAVRSRL